MKKIVLKTIVLVMALLMSFCCFVGCQPALTWQYNDQYHWHQVDGVIKDKAEHTFSNGKCTVCRMSDVGDEGIIDGSNDLEWN